jgi:hypothetical protein
MVLSGSSGRKLCENSSKPINLEMVVHASHPSYVGHVNRMTTVQVNMGINRRPHLKNNQSKKDWRSGSSGSGTGT